MKRTLIMALAALLAASVHAGTGATITWVTNYVAKAIANSTAQMRAEAKTTESNSVTSTTIEADGYKFVMTFEQLTEPAIIAVNATATAQGMGVTNGVIWVWSQANTNYTNKALSPITPTLTNLVWSTLHSADVNGSTVMKDNAGNTVFGIERAMIQKSTADIWK